MSVIATEEKEQISSTSIHCFRCGRELEGEWTLNTSEEFPEGRYLGVTACFYYGESECSLVYPYCLECYKSALISTTWLRAYLQEEISKIEEKSIEDKKDGQKWFDNQLIEKQNETLDKQKSIEVLVEEKSKQRDEIKELEKEIEQLNEKNKAQVDKIEQLKEGIEKGKEELSKTKLEVDKFMEKIEELNTQILAQNLKISDKNIALGKYEEVFKNSLKEHKTLFKLKEFFNETQLKYLSQNEFSWEDEFGSLEKKYFESCSKIVYSFKQTMLDKINLFIYKSNKQIKTLSSNMKTTIEGFQKTFNNRPDLFMQLTSTLETQEKSLQEDIDGFKQILESGAFEGITGTLNTEDLDKVSEEGGTRSRANNSNKSLALGSVHSGEPSLRQRDSRNLSKDLTFQQDQENVSRKNTVSQFDENNDMSQNMESGSVKSGSRRSHISGKK